MPTRHPYLEEVYDELEAWTRRIDLLEERARQAEGEAHAPGSEQIEALRAKTAEIRAHLAEVQKRNEASLRQLKEGADTTWKWLAHEMKRVEAELG